MLRPDQGGIGSLSKSLTPDILVLMFLLNKSESLVGSASNPVNVWKYQPQDT